MTEPGTPPSDSAIADWIGKESYKYWKHVTHPNQKDYPGQRIMVINIANYAYLIPYVENDEELQQNLVEARK